MRSNIPIRWGRREGGPDTRLATIRTLKIAQHHIGAAIGIGKQRFGILLALEAALQLFLDDIADFHKATQAEALAIGRRLRTGKLDDGGIRTGVLRIEALSARSLIRR